MNSNKELLLYKGSTINYDAFLKDPYEEIFKVFEEMDVALHRLYSKINPDYMEKLEYRIYATSEKIIWFIKDDNEYFRLVYQKNTGHIYLSGDLKLICIDGCIYKYSDEMITMCT